MNAQHIAGGEPMSLWRENRAKLCMSRLVNLNGSLPPPPPPPSVLRTFPSPSWGRQHFLGSVDLAPRETQK